MVTRLALVCSLILAASVAAAFPYMDGNTADRAHKGIVMDTLLIPHNASRGIYLIDAPVGGVRSNMDSLLTLWRNGGATPRLRRIQHILMWPMGTPSAINALFDITFYKDGATSQNRLSMVVFTNTIDIPVEADSIRITSRTGVGTNLELSYIIW